MSRRASLAAALLSLLAVSPTLAAAQALKAGVVTAVEGEVTVTRAALAPQPLRFKDDVFVDDTMTTGDRSIARVLLGGTAVVTVRERSVLTITEAPGRATIDLAAGKIALAVAREKMRPRESIEIRAANAVAGIRGSVVVAEVSGAAVTFSVLHGEIEAVLAGEPASATRVGAMQQLRGGTVRTIMPAQLTQILHGLSSGKVWPATGGGDQAREIGVRAGLALATSFTGVGSAAAVSVAPPVGVPAPSVPILPLNRNLPVPAASSTPVGGASGSP